MRFRELLKHKGLSYSDVAKELNVSKGLVYFWCKEKHAPMIKEIVGLSKLLNVSIDEIVMMFYKQDTKGGGTHDQQK